MEVLKRGATVQKIRLASGLVLFAFALTHFLNHALGLVDLETMQEVQGWRTAVTRSIPGTIVLGAALVVHMALGLYKLAMRETLRLPAWELVQIALGLLIPFLLLPHIVNTRISWTFYGVEDSYLYELAKLWPDGAVLQSALLLMVWIHGCMGIHFWLRLHGPYRRIQPGLLLVAIAVPIMALGGFMISGRAVAQLIQSPEMLARVKELTGWPDAPTSETLASYRLGVRIGFAGLLALIAAVIGWRTIQRHSGPKFSIKYLGGPTVKVSQGPTLLEISRQNRVPHASVCGGRARCSTCRVRIEHGGSTLPAPVFPEQFTLASIGAPHNVRLACQIRPCEPITITRLLRPASTGPQAAELEETDSAGVEKSLAVMFLDMRDFTSISQNRLPYDLVYLLNEFFAATGQAIASHGGWIDKFLGDGLLAVFGQRHGVEAGCRQALRAARAIDLALDHVNAKLAGELGGPMRVGIGIHGGPLLLGRIGYGEAVDLTVIGSSVNVASRLEGLAKEKGVQIVLSRDVAHYAGWRDIDPATIERLNVRGSSEPLDVVYVQRGRDLPASILLEAEGESERASADRGDEIERKQAGVR